MQRISFFAILAVLFVGCKKDSGNLPILGEMQVIDGDTIYHEIPEFSFVNQDSLIVSNETFSGKIYVADFFFTSCPTICPQVKKQMLRIHDKYIENPRISLLSHTIDPKRDDVAKLNHYSQALAVSSDKWHFVTGDQKEIYRIADDYFSIAIENPDAPGGFDHSGRLILVDEKGRVRSFCNGTEAEDVTRFMKDIDRLLNEN